MVDPLKKNDDDVIVIHDVPEVHGTITRDNDASFDHDLPEMHDLTSGNSNTLIDMTYPTVVSSIALVATTIQGQLDLHPSTPRPTCSCDLPLQRYGIQHGFGQKADCGYKRFQNNIGNARVTRCPITITYGTADEGRAAFVSLTA